MKYSEFEVFMNHAGLKIKDYEEGGGLLVENTRHANIAWISKEETRRINIDWAAFGYLTKENQEFVFKKCYELSCTPLKEREEKKYRLKYYLHKIDENNELNTIFSESELDNMDISGFIKEEVTG